MTTTTNNLIDQVGGIEKAKQLDEMLQKHGISEEWKISIINGMWHRSSVGFTHKDLRTAIAQHDKTWVEKRFGIKKWHPIPEHHMCTDKQSDQEFNVGDLVVKTHPKNTILWPVLGVYKNGGVWLDYKGFCWKPPRVRHATPAEIKAGRRLDHSVDVTDMVTDIRNHISPNTKVVEL